MVIGHSGDTTDIDYLEELINNGSYIGMDRFGVDAFLPFEDRVNTVARMCERGHADKTLARRQLLFRRAARRPAAGRRAELALPAHPQRRDPALKERGVTDEQLHTMLVDNPRRIFERQGAYQ
ncbi:phosphotriesterase family protein [Mycobacterium xenopi 3993]|nr:phosphotriesterase family protein [Mycobacterium xenopi 3993]